MGQQQPKKTNNIEDYEPGASKEEVFQALGKVAVQKIESKRPKKRGGQPRPASS
jgi:hypothetical protein